MLVLTRKKNDICTIVRGTDTIVVKVLEVRGGKVKLGFTAPPEYDITREESPKKFKTK